MSRRARACFHVLAKPAGPLCNLACGYCFYLDKRGLFPAPGRLRMADAVLEAFTRQYLAAQPPGTREVQFSWQGGEPTLMGLSFFRRALGLQRRYARPGIRIANALQTNGTLLDDEWGRFLREHEFLVGISVDGPQALHDAWRRDSRGRGSFRAVMRGVEVLRRHGVAFNTLTVVHGRNGSRAREVYDFLTQIGSTFLQFIPLVEPAPGGGVSERSVAPQQYGRFLARVFDAWLEAGHVGSVFVREFETILGLLAGGPAGLCVHAEACGRALALEHDGQVFACDHFVDGEHRLGSVLEEGLAALVDGERQTAFGTAKRRALPAACLACAWLPLCRGGCPKDRLARSPDGETGLNHLCAGYRLFFEHSVPVFEAMARCLHAGRPAADFALLAPQAVGRNAPCPCGSGRKHKRCCLRA